MIDENAKHILIRHCTHGLGDGVQLTALLQIIHHNHPQLTIDVVTKLGQHSLFHGLADKVWLTTDNITTHYDQVIDLKWWEPSNTYPNAPSTKVSRCLSEVFQIEPTICPYTINITEDSRARVDAYLADIPSPFVAIHYEGNSSTKKKNIQHHVIRRLCELLLTNGYTPLILDWDSRSPLPDNRTIFNPDKHNDLWLGTNTGDGNTLAALIEKAALFVGIDSGPLHVSLATTTPSIGIWTRHHPLHFADLSGDCTHLIPRNHEAFIRGNKAQGLAFFNKHYQSVIYDELEISLINLVSDQLGITLREQPVEFMSARYKKDFFSEAKASGLDLTKYGDWQRDYGVFIVQSLGLQKKTILDVGCACGSITQGLQRAGARCHGIDIDGDLVTKCDFDVESIDCCDAANLWMFYDESIDCIHCHHLFGDVREEWLPQILSEFSRVLTPDGVIITVEPMGSFIPEFREGFENVTKEFADRLNRHPLSKISEYKWEVNVYRTIQLQPPLLEQ